MTQPQLTAKDVALLRAAAEAGQLKVQFQLGRLLKHYPEFGAPGEWNQWLEKAAERGSGDACWELAEVALGGYGLPREPRRALVWLALGATLASAPCLRELGLLYLSGEGTGQPPSPQDALSCFVRAAKLNDPGAQFQLGRCYAKGLGTTANFVLAKEWLTKAAAAGDASAVAALKNIAVGGVKAAAELP